MDLRSIGRPNRGRKPLDHKDLQNTTLLAVYPNLPEVEAIRNAAYVNM